MITTEDIAKERNLHPMWDACEIDKIVIGSGEGIVNKVDDVTGEESSIKVDSGEFIYLYLKNGEKYAYCYNFDYKEIMEQVIKFYYRMMATYGNVAKAMWVKM